MQNRIYNISGGYLHIGMFLCFLRLIRPSLHRLSDFDEPHYS
jgi:hypothetical protein